MNQPDLPAPKSGFLITHFLVVSDQDRSREFYKSLFDAQVVLERDPVIMKVANRRAATPCPRDYGGAVRVGVSVIVLTNLPSVANIPLALTDTWA